MTNTDATLQRLHDRFSSNGDVRVFPRKKGVFVPARLRLIQSGW
jgi:hypothetical protein